MEKGAEEQDTEKVAAPTEWGEVSKSTPSYRPPLNRRQWDNLALRKQSMEFRTSWQKTRKVGHDAVGDPS